MTVLPDDHSEVVPLLPIPNRTVKRLSADDSADARVKVGHRQAFILKSAHPFGGRFFICFREIHFAADKHQTTQATQEARLSKVNIL